MEDGKGPMILDLKRINQTPFTQGYYNRFHKMRGTVNMSRGSAVLSDVIDQLRPQRESFFDNSTYVDLADINQVYHKYYGMSIKSYLPKNKVTLVFDDLDHHEEAC